MSALFRQRNCSTMAQSLHQLCVCVIMQMTSLFLFGQTAAEHAIGEYQYKYQFADTLQMRLADEEGMLLQKV